MRSGDLDSLDNVILLPHIGSACRTREGMAVLASLNVTGAMDRPPVWPDSENILDLPGHRDFTVVPVKNIFGRHDSYLLDTETLLLYIDSCNRHTAVTG
ncbi:MAG: hypothetical protein JXQ30_14315 [Spirochaetes bacterium]|nr:hypothetical protein [Spirochaetota bacterium]